MVGKSNSLGNENRIQMSKIFFLVSTPSRNILEAKEMDFFFTLIVTELLSSYLHSQRRQYASTSGPRTGMGSTT